MSRADIGARIGAAERVGIAVQSVGLRFGRNEVLHNVDLGVRPGEFLCLLGPSGCGKTTMLRCIAGLERPDRGRIDIGSHRVVDADRGLFVPPEGRHIGMVFQHYALWPHMTVADHLAYPLRKQGLPRADRQDKIDHIMKTVGLPDVLDRRPGQLSGGQQQRVALARALIYEPPVLLLDEPLSNLDATLRAQLRRELRQLHERLGTTTVMVTHDQEEAAALADVIAVMHRGRILQYGTAAELMDRPGTRFIAEFVGFDNFISGRVLAHRSDRIAITIGMGPEIELPLTGKTLATGTEVTIATRSDALQLEIDNGPVRDGVMVLGTVARVSKLGRGWEFEISIGDQFIRVRDANHESEGRFERGLKVRIHLLRGRFVVLTADADGS